MATKSKRGRKSKTIKIGITLGLKDNKESIWTNGIKQNVLMLIHMLKNSEKGYEVHLLNTLKADFSVKPSYLKDIEVSYFDDKYLDMDLIIVMGAQIHNHQIDKFKKSGKNKKVIAYKCGNNYVITMENILFGDRQHYSPRSDRELARWIISVFSFSKTHAMTGWRIGYLVADGVLVDELLKLSQFSVTSLATFSQLAALTALKDPEAQTYSQKMRSTYGDRRNLLASHSIGSWLEHAIILPQGTFYTLVDCREFRLPSTELAKFVVDRWGIAFTPGVAFGDSMDGYLRMCFATSESNVVQALDALKRLNKEVLV